MRKAIDMSPGVLAMHQIERLFKEEMLICKSRSTPDIDHSAFDLKLGDSGWELGE